VAQNLLDHFGILDARNDPRRSPAVITPLDVNSNAGHKPEIVEVARFTEPTAFLIIVVGRAGPGWA